MSLSTKPALLSRTFDRGLAASIGVQNLFVFDEASGTLRDLMDGTGLITAPLTSGMTAGSDTEGLAVACNGTSGAQNIALPSPMQTATGANLVLLGRIKASGQQGGNPGQAFGLCSSGATQNGFGIGFDGSATPNVGGTWLTSNGAGTLAYSAGALNTWYTVAAQAKFSGGTNSVWSWVNGQPAVTGQGTSTSGSGSTFNEIVIGGQHRSAGFLRWLKGSIEWAAIIAVPQTPMSDAWHWQLYASDFPYNLFRRDKPWWLKGSTASVLTGAGSSSGSSSVTGGGASLNIAAGSSSGAASISAIGAALALFSGNVASFTATTGSGSSLWASSGPAQGISSVAGTGASLAKAPGSALGASLVAGTAIALVIGAGSSNGLSGALGAGLAAIVSQGTSTGLGSVSGIGAALAASYGPSNGLSSANGAGASIWTSSAFVAAPSSVTGYGKAVVFGAGSSSGYVNALGYGAAIHWNGLPSPLRTVYVTADNRTSVVDQDARAAPVLHDNRTAYVVEDQRTVYIDKAIDGVQLRTDNRIGII